MGWTRRVRNLLTRRRLVRLVLVVLVVVIEWGVAHVPTTEARVFDHHAREIERTPTWRYGCVSLHHGPILVKTRLRPDSPPMVPLEPDEELALRMLHARRMIPRKVVFELGFYASLWALWSLGIERWRRRFGGDDEARLRRCVVRALAWTIMVTAVLAPFLTAGYGEPLFANQYGPGPFSRSMFGETGTSWGRPHTYNGLVQGLLFWPLITVSWSIPDPAWCETRAGSWVIGVVFYGLVGALLELLATWPLPRRPPITL